MILRLGIITLLFYSILTCKQQPPLIITLHNKTSTINSDAQCNKSLWNNNVNDACECCLIQHYSTESSTKSADDIIKTCITDAKLCTDQAITALKSAKKASSSESLLNALYDDVIIRPMMFDTSLLTNGGQFTETSLPQFLAQAYQEKKLNYPAFSNANCIKAKDILTKGGYNTLQLFLVTSTCSTEPASIFIVKEAKEGIGEATKLKEIEQVSQFKDIIAPKVKKGLPSISLPLAYFSYPDAQTLHYISAMPSAKGKVLSEWALKYTENQSAQNKELLARAFLILGTEASNFHKLFNKPGKNTILGTTVAHGDFHLLNLFFDEIGGHFTFIDNETIALYLKNRVNPAIDICKPFYIPFNTNYSEFLMKLNGIDLQTWYDITLKNFITGYIKTYAENQQKQLLQELKKMFNDFDVPSWVGFYNIEEVKNNYINPIFDNLIQSKATIKK